MRFHVKDVKFGHTMRTPNENAQGHIIRLCTLLMHYMDDAPWSHMKVE